jgi:hypothetical protein
MATVIKQPSQGPFHLLAILNDFEPLARTLNHLQINFMGRLQAPYLFSKPLGIIAALNPDLPEPLYPGGKIAL